MTNALIRPIDRYHPLVFCAVANEPFELIGGQSGAHRRAFAEIGGDPSLEQRGAKVCIHAFGVPQYDAGELAVAILEAICRNEPLRPAGAALREMQERHSYLCGDTLRRLANAVCSLCPTHEVIAWWHCTHAVAPLITGSVVKAVR